MVVTEYGTSGRAVLIENSNDVHMNVLSELLLQIMAIHLRFGWTRRAWTKRTLEMVCACYL